MRESFLCRKSKTSPCGSYLCEVRTTERPSLMMLRMQFHRARRALGSIPVVGSSCSKTTTEELSQRVSHCGSDHHLALTVKVEVLCVCGEGGGG